MNIDGAIGVSLVDRESGMPLGAAGGGKYLDLDVAAAGNAEVARDVATLSSHRRTGAGRPKFQRSAARPRAR